MPIQLSHKMLDEIAQDLDCGMCCFYHKTTGELESYPDEMRNPGFDEEFWTDVMEKVENNFDQYIPFKAMESRESFNLIEDFIDQVQDIRTKERFYEVIQRRKPFQQFKNLLLDYPDLRQQWFDYKNKRYIEYVQEQLDIYNKTEEEKE